MNSARGLILNVKEERYKEDKEIEDRLNNGPDTLFAYGPWVLTRDQIAIFTNFCVSYSDTVVVVVVVFDGANDMGSFAGAGKGKFERIYWIHSSSTLENKKNWSWHYRTMHHPRNAPAPKWIWSWPSNVSFFLIGKLFCFIHDPVVEFS